ncbi:flagellar biosynthesis protein FlaG [Veronia nyctiphanis]|uniref:Flagellar biosynthesis protein FlaG n=1 Tax=Veronia nyctiphanis TaxID=1278244 RepID=A0A4Q0YPF1_9GAMM|nr:flagellar protein FlaG [Veronia nyctiphanis]RXJ72907.1 flagellar biosynthesis protein FlaG [Veronia nyctiphanis]
MDNSSVSLSSNAQVNPQTGTNVANKKVDGEQPKIANQRVPVSTETEAASNSEQLKEQLGKAQKLQKEQLEMLVSRLDDFVSTFNKGLSFRLDEASGKSVVTVYEMSTGDVIRQIPEKEMLELAQQLSLHARGLVQEKV